jgi:hypothetical protein
MVHSYWEFLRRRYGGDRPMDEAVLAKILEAQYFITHQLQKLSDNSFTGFAWNQRKSDWGADVYHLAAYVGTRRLTLSFSSEELLADHGSPVWERVLVDKVLWFIDESRGLTTATPDRQEPTTRLQSDTRLTALYVLQNADFQYVSKTRKWAVCGWRQVVYVMVSSSLTVDEARKCMEELWGAFIALKRQYIKIYAVLDLNRMDLNTEEFRQYMKEHWLHLLDRRDLAIVFVDKS